VSTNGSSDGPEPLRRNRSERGGLAISVMGNDYLGAVHAACIVTLGHNVAGFEVAAAKIASLSAGQPPFFEPGLADLPAETTRTSRLLQRSSFNRCSSYPLHLCRKARRGQCGPPSHRCGRCQPAPVFEAWRAGSRPNPRCQSTPPSVWQPKSPRLSREQRWRGTLSCLRKAMPCRTRSTQVDCFMVWPEGVPRPRAAAILNRVCAKAIADKIPVVITDCTTTQLVKVAANSFLATKILQARQRGGPRLAGTERRSPDVPAGGGCGGERSEGDRQRRGPVARPALRGDRRGGGCRRGARTRRGSR
jgi:UDPglucose 6-dehydrogenase